MLRILVLVKAVPLGAPLMRLDADGALLEADELRLDPIDELSIAWALRELEAGRAAAVSAVCVGGARADVALRAALARGCGDALRIAPEAGARLDVAAVAALAGAAARCMETTVVACGYESYDASSGALPAALAAELGWSLVSRARDAALGADGTLDATRSVGAGTQRVRVALPAVVSLVEGELAPRHPRVAAVLATRRTAIPAMPASELLRGRALTRWDDGLLGVDAVPAPARTPRFAALNDGVAEILRALDASAAEARDEHPVALAAPAAVSVTDDAASPAPTLYLAIAADPAAAALVLAALPPDVLRADVSILLLGCPLDGDAALLPAGRVDVAPQTPFDSPLDGLGEHVLERLGTRTTVLMDASQPARDLAGWLAVRARARLAWAVEQLGVEDGGLLVRRVVNGGDGRLRERIRFAADGSPTVLLTRTSAVRAGAHAGAPSATVRAIALPVAPADVRERDTEPPRDGLAKLAGARIVVAVGRGIGGAEQVPLFRALAARLGAALGASRVVVDRGWLPFAHQVGQTGAAVAPELYLAFGISGAVQHLVGMRESRRVIAVNSDRHAPLCALSDVVVEADAVAVARSLLEQIDNDEESRE